MSNIYIANTDFEFELENPSLLSLKESIERIPQCMQLQFLPLLYANNNEAIGVTRLPSHSYVASLLDMGLWKTEQDLPLFIELDDPLISQYDFCDSWGASTRVKNWAEQKKICYTYPSFSLVQEVNSKAFSFENAERSFPSALLWNKSDLQNWLLEYPEKSVLKSCFGLSGRGNRIIDGQELNESTLRFCNREWCRERPVIAESWLRRCVDFSTQWELIPNEEPIYHGAVLFETNAFGAYLGTICGPEEILFFSYTHFLEQHKIEAKRLLKLMQNKGYFGFVGFDALLYRSKQEPDLLALYPIVEINARRTMSLAILLFQKRWFLQEVVRSHFLESDDKAASLLPNELLDRSGKAVKFAKTLTTRSKSSIG